MTNPEDLLRAQEIRDAIAEVGTPTLLKEGGAAALLERFGENATAIEEKVCRLLPGEQLPTDIAGFAAASEQMTGPMVDAALAAQEEALGAVVDALPAESQGYLAEMGTQIFEGLKDAGGSIKEFASPYISEMNQMLEGIGMAVPGLSTVLMACLVGQGLLKMVKGKKQKVVA